MINFRFPATLLLAMSLFSCAKEPVKSITSPPDNDKVKTKAERIDSIKRELLTRGEEIGSVVVNVDSTKVSFVVRKEVNGAERYFVFEPGDKTGTIGLHRIYPGMIIDGKAFLMDGTHQFPTVGSEKDPAQKLIMEARDGKVLNSTVLDALRQSDVAVYRSTAVREIGEPDLDRYKSDPIVRIGAYSTYQEIKDSIFFTKRSLTTNLVPEDPRFEYTQDTDKVKKNQGLYVFFKQVYYTIKIDTVATDWRLLADDFSDSIQAKMNPVFIPEVSYGRYGLLCLETDASFQEIEKIVKIALDDFDKLLPEQQEVLKNASVRCTFFGLTEDWSWNSLTQSALGRVKLFSDVLKNNTYTFRQFGDAPIFYKLATVRGNQSYASSVIDQTLQFDL